MAKVPLRKYNHEIEALIERGQTDEAIAHCRHILATFSKHLETYRLLGKAYLESKRYPEATDIFERVLMAVPDDFVSQVGMSIMADEQKRLDDAIWHMERAFEKQPSNAAIQAELQRLYGRRDGHEPPKIRLTRGALAHMYYQGELYLQAISEVRSALAEDPTRADLQSLLALAYFRAGQKVETSETCSQLLASFPYNFDANRILVEILPGAGMSENTQVYRQRVIELDPYAAQARGSIFQADEAPDNSISLERLDYKGQPVETSPDWGKSLGIGLGAAAASNAQPDWLKTDAAAAPASPASQPSAPPFETPHATPEPAAPARSESSPLGESQPPASGGDAIPEWMRQAGWGESSGTFDESAAAALPGDTAGPELAKADLPDWIKSMAPAETEPPAASPAAPSEDEDTLEWLNKLGGDKPFGSAPPSETSQDKTFDAALDQTIADLPPGGDESPAPSGGLPDWLSNLDQPSQETASPAAGAETSGWLSELGDAGQVSASAAAAETADWLATLDEPADAASPSASVGQDQPAQETAPAAETAESDWFSKLDQPTQETASAAETADWLSKLDEPSREPPPAEPAAPAAVSPEAGIGSLGTSVAEQDAAMLWLESLAAKQGAKSEELITNPNDRLEKAPEWVEQAKAAGEAQPAAPAPVEPEAPAPVSESAWAESAPPELSAMDQTGVWLRELEAKDSQPEKPVEPEPAAWSGEIEAAPPVAEPSAESAPEADLPTWLRGFEAREAASAPGSTDEIPEWLKGDEREAPEAPIPTRSADWKIESSKVAPQTVVPEPKPELKPEPKFEPRPEPRPAAVRKPEPKPRPAPADKPKLKRTGMLPPLIDPNLASARDALSHGKIPDALQAYSALIRKGKLLEDITFDLKEALYRFPVEVSIWQALGDAYMRANRLQDALDAYTKAEELLR